MASGKFGTSICCMDGRIQIPLNHWIKENYSVDFVDTITEPGIEKIISEGDFEKVKLKASISINKHNSSVIVISGHHDCAGNPVSKEEHIRQIKKSVEKVKTWDFSVQVIGVWVNDKWNIEQLQ